MLQNLPWILKLGESYPKQNSSKKATKQGNVSAPVTKTVELQTFKHHRTRNKICSFANWKINHNSGVPPSGLKVKGIGLGGTLLCCDSDRAHGGCSLSPWQFLLLQQKNQTESVFEKQREFLHSHIRPSYTYTISNASSVHKQCLAWLGTKGRWWFPEEQEVWRS